EQARSAAAKAAAEEAARREAETDKSKFEAPQRVASSVLNAEERATFVKRIQEVLKQSRCYDGAINGSSDDAQKSLDRYIDSARQHGQDKPARIELAKATAADFDLWLKDAGVIKGSLCSNKQEKRPVASKQWARKESRMPDFPWPPPNPSAWYVIPNDLIVNASSGAITLEDIAGRLERALDNAGYSQRSFFKISGGFSL